MSRLVSIVFPSKRGPSVLPTLHALQNGNFVHHMIVYTSQQLTHVSFKSKPKHLQKVLKDLQTATGVGVEFGTIDVVLLQLTKPAIGTPELTIESEQGPTVRGAKTNSKRREYRIDERMTMDEICSFVDEGNHLTFNYMALLAMASIMAGCGLLGDSSVVVVASMLVSPLMGPILSITFGLSVQDTSHVRKGLRNELVGVSISFITGLIMGVIGGFSYSPEYRSTEITSRGQASGLIYGFVVACATGIAIVLAISAGGVNAIVGSAISVSLLPPVVCSGICCSMSLIYATRNGDTHNASHYAVFAVVSFALFTVNFLSVLITGFVTFRFVKNVGPEDYRILHIDQTPAISRTNSQCSDVDDAKVSSVLHLRPMHHDEEAVQPGMPGTSENDE